MLSAIAWPTIRGSREVASLDGDAKAKLASFRSLARFAATAAAQRIASSPNSARGPHPTTRMRSAEMGGEPPPARPTYQARLVFRSPVPICEIASGTYPFTFEVLTVT